MSAILTLIFILSIAIFFTNQRVFRELRVFSLSGFLLLLGLCFSESGLIPILQSTQDAIAHAMRVALVFVSFFFGFRHSRHPLGLLMFLFPFFALTLVPNLHLVGADRLVLAALPGVAVALATRLILDPQSQLATPAKLAFGGVCTLAAGWSWGIGTPEALTGYTFGLVSGLLFPTDIFQDRELLAAKMSFSMAIVFFVGTFFSFSKASFIYGSVLGLIYLFLQFFSRSDLLNQWRSWSLPVVLSLHFASEGNEASEIVISSAVIAFLISEFVLAGARMARSSRGVVS